MNKACVCPLKSVILPGSTAASVRASSRTCSQVCVCYSASIWELFIEIKLHTAMKLQLLKQLSIKSMWDLCCSAGDTVELIKVFPAGAQQVAPSSVIQRWCPCSRSGEISPTCCYGYGVSVTKVQSNICSDE